MLSLNILVLWWSPCLQGLFLSADGAQAHVDRGGLALANHSGFMANNYWDGVGRIENKREKARLPEG